LSRVRKTVLAETDLADIWFYIALDNPDAADGLIDKIEQQSGLLARNPKLGRVRPELMEDLRSFPIGNYVVFYRPEPEGIEIVRVVHGARDVPGQFPQLDTDMPPQ